MAREFMDDPSLAKELAEGEKIVWRGVSEAFPFMTADSKKSITTRWLVSIIVAVAIIAIYIVMASKAEQGINAWVLIIVLLGVCYYALMPILDKNNIFKKCKYYVTDRRVLVHYGNRDLFALPLAGLKTEFTAAENGCVHVKLGSCVGIGEGKLRLRSFSPLKGDNDAISGFVFYNVADSKALRELF